MVTFIHNITEYRHFEEDLLLEGEQIISNLEKAHHEVSSFIQGLKEQNLESIPILVARATPYGKIRSSDFAKIIDKMLTLVEKAGWTGIWWRYMVQQLVRII